MAVGVTAVSSGAAVVTVLTANRLQESKGQSLGQGRWLLGGNRVGPTFGTGQQPHFCVFRMKQQLVCLGQLVWSSHATSAG